MGSSDLEQKHSAISAMNIPAVSHSEKPGTFKSSLKRLISGSEPGEKVCPTSASAKLDINMNPSSSPEVAETERRSEAGIEPESSQQPPPPAPVIVLSSTGPSGERQGESLGEFKYLEQYNNSPAYRQRHTVAGEPLYLYRAQPGEWRVGRKLGGSAVGLLNRTDSHSVPTSNWLYDAEHGWQSDPELTITTSLPSVCGVISISLLGAAATAHPSCGGKYRATGDWSAGRPVFSNGTRYLRVRPGWNHWEVTDQVKKESSSRSKIKSSSATLCPASHKSGSWSYWEYWTYNSNGNAYIRLTCTTPQHWSSNY